MVLKISMVPPIHDRSQVFILEVQPIKCFQDSWHLDDGPSNNAGATQADLATRIKVQEERPLAKNML